MKQIEKPKINPATTSNGRCAFKYNLEDITAPHKRIDKIKGYNKFPELNFKFKTITIANMPAKPVVCALIFQK